MKKFFYSIVIILVFSFLVTGCSNNLPTQQYQTQSTYDAQSIAMSGFGEYEIKTAEPLVLNTSSYNGGAFTMELPVGWRILTSGQYTDFSFYAFDPQMPERKIFFFCKLEPFTKSSKAKSEREALAATVPENDSYGYHLFAAMPVLYPATAEKFLDIYNDMLVVAKNYSSQCIPHNYPDLNDIKVIETHNNNTPCAPTCLDNSILRIMFTSDNSIKCQGLLGAQVTDKISTPSPMTGTDLGFLCVYDFCGVTAPEAEFAELESTLLRCLSTFTFTQAYLQETKTAVDNQTDAILAANRSLQETYNSYSAAWNSRQTSYDIISQKNSDATLGYDRLYDPDTGEVYRAEAGFYDSYNTNREQYQKSNLQIIDNSSEDYYLNGIDYYIYK